MTMLAQTDLHPYRVTEALVDEEFAHIRRSLVLDWCKWDPQVGDISTLAPFAIVLESNTWRTLGRSAEALARETLAAEEELLQRPDLMAKLGIPRRIRDILHRHPPTPPAPRVIRFDFHWTLDGWRISEANTDVPGGYAESGPFASMMAEQFPGTFAAGDPGALYAKSIARCADGMPVGLLSAAGFMEDHQVVAHLARRLRDIGVSAIPMTLSQLAWHGGRAYIGDSQLGAIVRFFQSEWLVDRHHSSTWPNFLTGRTPVTNCVSSILTESKRFPLVWDALETPLPRWRQLLPETRDVRTANWRNGDWILKTALCNTGDTVTLPSAKSWRRTRWSAWLNPSNWIAQQRFQPVPIDTPMGAVHPCIGVYVIDGRAGGIYGRISPKPIIDFEATDVAILVEDE